MYQERGRWWNGQSSDGSSNYQDFVAVDVDNCVDNADLQQSNRGTC